MQKINVIVRAGRRVSFEILPDVPAVGDIFKGRRVREVAPYLPDHPQEDPEIYNYALWRVRVRLRPLPYLVAVREPEADTL